MTGKLLEQRRLRRCIGMVAACVLGVLGVGGVPVAAHADETNAPSAAEAQLINLNLIGIDLAELGHSFTEYPDGPQLGTIDAQLLNDGIMVDLGGIDVALIKDANAPGAKGVLNLANTALLNSYANSSSPNWARGSAGVLNEDGSLGLTSYEDGTLQNSNIDLTQLLDQLGLGSALGPVIQEAAIEIGAVGSQMTVGNLVNGEERCTFIIDDQYVITDLNIGVESPLIGGIITGLTGPGGAVTGVGAALDELVGPSGEITTAINAVTDPLETILNALNLGLVKVESEVGVDRVVLDTAPIITEVQNIVNTPLVSGDGKISVDLSTGEIDINLAQYVMERWGATSLNELDPNTPVLDAATLNSIMNGLTDLLVGDPAEHPNSLVAKVLDAVTVGIYKSSLAIELNVFIQTCVWVLDYVCTPVIDAPITVAGQLGGYMDADGYPAPTIDVSALEVLSLPVGELLQPVTNLLTGLVTSIGGILDTAVFDPSTGLLAGLQTALVGTETVPGVLTTVVNTLIGTEQVPGVLRTLLDFAVDLTINRQPAPGDLGTDSYTLSALEVIVLPTLYVIPIHLATSTAKATAPVCLTLDNTMSQDSQFSWATQATADNWLLTAESNSSVFAITGATGTEPVTERPIPAGDYGLDTQVAPGGITGGIPAHGYQTEWECVDQNNNAVPYSDAVTLARPAGFPSDEAFHVTCHAMTTLITAAATWNKVDANNDNTALGGSEWMLSRTSAPIQSGLNVADYSDATDVGAFNVAGLPVGTYALVETAAPIGYVKHADPITFEVFTDGTTDLTGIIANEPVAVPSIPLTGGVGASWFLLGGVGILTLAIGLGVASPWISQLRNSRR